ncbi:hypothetical protein BH24ACI2_BH24ACI2_04890 [soil metagenome]|jgi:hypothetical protein|nr:hypothetical protein [Acidobacteriota bacterium]
MKKFLSLSLTLLLLQSAFCFVLSPIGVSAQTQEILTNQKIVEMVKTGLSNEIVVAKIKSSKNSFDTSTTAIKELKKAGVSDTVILEMMQNASNREEQIKNNTSPSNVSAQPNEPLAFGLQDGTPVKLRIGRTLSSADAKTGETVDFEVLEDVKIGDTVIIPRGGIALGTVTQGKPKGRMGKGGKLDINIDSVRLVSGEKVALRAVKETKGGGRTGAMTGAIVATSILFFPAAPFFLFMKGKDITIPKGTEITAYINGDIPLDPNKFNTTSK